MSNEKTCEWCGEEGVPHPQCIEAEEQCEREKEWETASAPRDERELEWCRTERAWVPA